MTEKHENKLIKFFNKKKIARYSQDKRGAVLVIAAFALPIIFILIGMGIDLTRVSSVNAKLSYAVDAAAVAGLKYDQASAVQNATKVFYANFPNGFYDVSVTPQITVASDGSQVTVTASASLPTTFANYVGIKTLPIRASATVKKGYSSLELSMVLDVTGSMAWSGKIQALKSAAANLVNKLYGNNNTRPNASISIVPFVATVNIGTNRTAWLADPTTLSSFPSQQPWKGCVMAGTNEDTDNPPSSTSNKWKVYYTPTTYSSSNPTPIKINDWRISSGQFQIVHPIYDGPNGNDPVSIGPNRSCGPALLPTVNDKTQLLNLISSFTPIYGGGTFGNLGLGWGWRMLSPRWTGYLPIAPKAYNTDGNLKALVFMTDGFNDWHVTDAPPLTTSTPDPTAYGITFSSNTLGITDISKDRQVIDQKFTTMCNQIKANGIQVFTILFMGGDTSAQNMLRNCASKPEWFANATTGQELINFFDYIAEQVDTLVIIQ
jgi:Flp pilus assembly protein TadG